MPGTAQRTKPFFPDLDYPVIAVPKDEAMDKAKKTASEQSHFGAGTCFICRSRWKARRRPDSFFYPRMLLLADQASGKLYYNDLLVVRGCGVFGRLYGSQFLYAGSGKAETGACDPKAIAGYAKGFWQGALRCGEFS